MRFENKISDELMCALEAFIVHWLGEHNPEYGAKVEELEHLNIPSSLRKFYKFCYNWPEKEKTSTRNIGVFSKQNELVKPSLEYLKQADDNYGLMIIALENQGVTSWAIPPGENETNVYQMDMRNESANLQNWRYPGWHIGFDTIPEFLHWFCLKELFSTGIIFEDSSLYEEIELGKAKIERLSNPKYYPDQSYYLYKDDILIEQLKTMSAKDIWLFSARDEKALSRFSQS